MPWKSRLPPTRSLQRVNGVAMGGSSSQPTLTCDIIIAAENAIFALPEPRVGLIAGAGGVHRLPRSIPIKKAMGMTLAGRRVPAREGFELGFVTEVVPEGHALGGRQHLGDDDPRMFAQGRAGLETGILSGDGRTTRASNAHGFILPKRKTWRVKTM